MNIKKNFTSLSFLIFCNIFLCSCDHRLIDNKSSWPKDGVVVSDQEAFIEAIDKANEEIVLGTYKIHDHTLPDENLIAALKRAVARGVKVHLLIEKNLTTQEKLEGDNNIKVGDALALYESLGVELLKCPKQFRASHIKILIADDAYAFIGTTNFDKKFNTQEGITRDFAIITKDSAVLRELKAVLHADQKNEPITLPDYSIKDITPYKLTWGPDQQRKHFLEMIDSAEKSIQIYQQDLQDQEIVEHLIRAIKTKRVQLKILMSQYPFGLKKGNLNELSQRRIRQVGGHIQLTSSPTLHIHAKVLIIDRILMYVGSCNFFPDAIDQDRQVGLITKDPQHINRVSQIFENDWHQTH